MAEATTILAKYSFLDVVDFSRNRSVEAQSDIVETLNGIVKASVKYYLEQYRIVNEKVIYLPTGDGICIALLNIESPFDINLLIALSIVKGIYEHNEKTEDRMRKFQIRIGLNSNTDNLVTDINGNRNVAGAGINVSQRVMSMADGNQILVSESVFDTLRYREKYMRSFKKFIATVKHDIQMPIYQFAVEGYEGLDTGIPSALQKKHEHLIIRIAAWIDTVICTVRREFSTMGPAPNKSLEPTASQRVSRRKLECFRSCVRGGSIPALSRFAVCIVVNE